LDPGYFDSSVFLAIFNGDPSGSQIKALLREMRRDKSRIHTSIVTIQEVSVLSCLALGQQLSTASQKVTSDENYGKVHRLARIHGITKDIALLAAKLEALMILRKERMTGEERRSLSPRRKWDCFHIATALEMNCKCIYTLDAGMMRCKELITPAYALSFLEPGPAKGELFSGVKGVRLQ
jgi:predicted nucleic acid-binding protein